jgi:hypothetical protein
MLKNVLAFSVVVIVTVWFVGNSLLILIFLHCHSGSYRMFGRNMMFNSKASGYFRRQHVMCDLIFATG